MAKHVKVLYELIDIKDRFGLPKFAGTLAELSEYTGVTARNIRKAIWMAEKKGERCKYVRVDLDDDEQFMEERNDD